ncbi:CWF19-like protein 2 [Lates japonicus]|uniref:CWF19-like protein 2 n=1 Tax=Lates japonicus TaxID=270547 RepID=A0AAD3RN11_LATJO|nr:CWF19-like protein 2 [Lates japonicus]
MAAHGVSFESSRSIEERKESKRQARQEALEKAKQQHEREERRKELKRQRGEDTWMLPEVNQRLEQIQEDGSVKSKKKKEKKSKKKKEKKKKAKKEKKTVEAGDGSSDSSEDSAQEWIEAQPQAQAAKPWQVSDESKPSESNISPAQNVQRDEWMTFDFLALKTTSTAERRAEKERLKEEERAKAQAIEEAGLHKLELNPYWKDGGTGLPPEEMAGTAAKKGPVVNDGGLSWLRKSYQRMKEQAEREKRSLNDVVAERYGSMEEFQQRLAEAEKAVYGQRRGGGDGDGPSRGGWRKGENEARERWRRREGDEEDRDPSEDDNSGEAPERPSTGFLKPSSDDEDSGPCNTNAPAWKKSSSPARESDSSEKAQQEKERDPGKTVTAAQDGPCGDKAAVTASRSESESEEEEEEEEEAPLLSEEEMNRLASELVKAEIRGKTAVVEKLRSQLDAARRAKESHAAQKKLQETAKSSQVPGRSTEDQEILLFRTDQSGRAWPVKPVSGPQEPHGGRRKKKPIETHVDGERVRYFQDDDNVGLQEMVRREKMSSAQDQNALYSRMAAKVRKQ